MAVVPFRIALAFICAMLLHGQRKTVLDNEYVRVLDVTTDGSTTKGRLHEHAMNRVMIYLSAGKQKLEYADGRTTTLEFEPGTAHWSPAGGMHTSQHVTGPFRVIEVELKKNAGNTKFGPLDPVRVDPKRYKVLHDYPQARVIRATAEGRARIPLHEHVPNRVIVFVSDMHARATDDSGKATDIEAKAGEVRWAGAAKHREENLSAKPFDVIVVELK